MRVFNGLDNLPSFVRPAATVGSYDGVHRGHKALIDCLVAEARAMGGESVVLTFDPHPRVTLGRSEGLRLLTTLDEKITLLEDLGVDNLIVIPFDWTFSALSGAEFVGQYIRGRVGAEVLVVGYNHRFGHDRVDAAALADDQGLRIVRVSECSVEGHHVSSTAIRWLLAEGLVAEAERLLGHPLKTGVTMAVNPDRAPLVDMLTGLWRASVEATHLFLTRDDIDRLLPLLRAAIMNIETLCVVYEGTHPVAFMGTEADKVEMLFVKPSHFGRGIGRQLMVHALARGIEYVDVNEQNTGAAGFYQHLGFEVFERSELDNQANPFPILRMRLGSHNKQ